MTTAERLKKIESTLAELNIRMSGAGGVAGNHNLLSATHPDTDPDSPVRGDIVVGIAGPEWRRYAIGAAGRFLRSDGVDPLYSAILVGDLPAHADEHEVGGGDLVDHDALTNFVANEHIDWTGASDNFSTSGTLGCGAFTLTQNLDTITLAHDGSSAYVKWSDGDLTLMTDEGTNTNTYVSILGKGTGFGVLEVYDTDDDSYIILGWKADDQPSITCDTTPTEFNFLHDRAADIKCWSSTTGNPYFYVYGYKTAVGVKYLRQRVEADGDALIEAENNLNIIAGGGVISFGDENLSTTGNITGQFLYSNAGTPRFYMQESGTIRAEFRYGAAANAWIVLTQNTTEDALLNRIVVRGEQDFTSVGIGMTPPAATVLAIKGATENIEIIDAGSAGSTEQDWIEVEIGGVQGYIRVFAGK